MGISVIVPSYNNQNTLTSVLDALLKQTCGESQLEIIVVDDHSTDASRMIIKKYPVVAVFNEENVGLAASLNKGISIAKHDILVTLHADTVPLDQTWLQQLVEPLKHFDVAATCSLQFPPNTHNRSLTLWERMMYAKQGPHNALNDKADAHKKAILDEIGLFDDKTYRTAGEDEDLALRLRLHGKIVQGTQAKVIHNHYFSTQSGYEVFKKLLQKEFSFGEAGGALRRKYPKHRLGAYVFPKPKSLTNDGLLRASICIGALIPYIQIACIPVVFAIASLGITKLAKENKKLMLLYPFFNITRFGAFTVGYIAGLIKGRQN
jgi:glycosyltransferase involved in cell wall biosynthesis